MRRKDLPMLFPVTTNIFKDEDVPLYYPLTSNLIAHTISRLK